MTLTAPCPSLDSSLAGKISLRERAPEDAGFLFRLYSANRAAELDAWHWPEAEREKFLRFQFLAREASLRASAPERDLLVLIEDRPAGRLAVGERRGAMHICDIALLPEVQGRGIGSALVRALMAETAASGQDLSCFAARRGGAARFYRRLGFRERAGDAMHAELIWEPGR